MKCGICKAEMEETKVTYTGSTVQVVIVIRHVPAYVCTKCQNIWYSETTSAQLERIVSSFASVKGRGKVTFSFWR